MSSQKPQIKLKFVKRRKKNNNFYFKTRSALLVFFILLVICRRLSLTFPLRLVSLLMVLLHSSAVLLVGSKPVCDGAPYSVTCRHQPVTRLESGPFAEQRMHLLTTLKAPPRESEILSILFISFL